jgi:expansin (peptidoglycan-binding protein)
MVDRRKRIAWGVLGSLFFLFQLISASWTFGLTPATVRAQEGSRPGFLNLVGQSTNLTGSDHLVFLPLVLRPAREILWHTGEGTYYDATGAGNCSFDPSPEDLMVAALNQSDYNNAALCGAYIEVVGPLGSTIVRIVDRCPECAPGDVDLSPQAFAQIAILIDGRVPIQWRIISPDLQGPIVYKFKEGSNRYWTAVQVRHHRNPIAKFEVEVSPGVFKSIPRTEYNYFVEAQGMGEGPYTFRVTDIYSNELQDSNVPFIEGGEIVGGEQFPPMP